MLGRIAEGGRGKGVEIKSGEIFERGYRETLYFSPRRGDLASISAPSGSLEPLTPSRRGRTSLICMRNKQSFPSSLPPSPTPSLSSFLLVYVFVLLVWPSERRVKRDVTSRYREEQATPDETAARRFLTRPKATARQLNLIPVGLGWLPRGVRDEGEETRERASPPIWARTFRHNRGTRPDDASGKIDRQVEQMQSGCRLDDMKIAIEIAWENYSTIYR